MSFPEDGIYLHPLTVDEVVEVKHAVTSMIAVLPEGDDARGLSRASLVSALEKLERHWCAWCPAEVRDLAANAHNAVANYGYKAREARKIGELESALKHYQPAVDAHFDSIKNETA